MDDQLVGLIQRVLAKTPEWLRNDLGSVEAAARERAEETLAAMIGSALQPADTGSTNGD